MDHDEVISNIKSWDTNILGEKSFIKVDTNLNNFKVHQISMTIPMDSNPLGLDTDELVLRTLKNEIQIDINKQVMIRLSSSKYFDYLDLTNSGGLNNHTDTRKLYNLICNCKEDYTSIITTGMIGAALQDLAEFTPIVNDNSGSNINIYHIGKLPDLEIWVNPFLNYNDGRLLLFKNITMNITDVVPSIQKYISNGATFTSRLMISYQLDYNIGDSKIIFILDSNSSETFRQYKSLQRDIKIDDILG